MSETKPYRVVEFDQFDNINRVSEYDNSAKAAADWMIAVSRAKRAELVCNFDTGEGPHGDGTTRKPE